MVRTFTDLRALVPPCCPYCTKPAALVGGDVIYPHRPDLAEKKFWSCEPCGAYVGCHPASAPGKGGQGDGAKPLGRLANAELRRAKQAAHAAFDPLWMAGPLKRREAYGWLAQQLGVPFPDCHIGEFDVELCRKVVQVCTTRAQAAA